MTLKKSENNGTEEIGLVTPTPGRPTCKMKLWSMTHFALPADGLVLLGVMISMGRVVTGDWQQSLHCADDILKHNVLKVYVHISIKISLKFVPRSPVINTPVLVLLIDWCSVGEWQATSKYLKQCWTRCTRPYTAVIYATMEWLNSS